MSNLIIGYARVSTDDQNLDLQKDALKKEKCEKIFEEKKSGKDFQREQLDRALEILRAGDTLVVWRLDRLGRSLKNLIELVTRLEDRKINFKSITENIDTTTATGKLIFHIFAALAEFERNLIRERTNAGLTAARARGRFGGRPKRLKEKEVSMIKTLYNEKNYLVKDICAMFKITKPTLYKYIKEKR